ncbi:MAG: LLM class flavin-dependent oxidoreductase [Burkholderiales bacterium]
MDFGVQLASSVDIGKVVRRAEQLGFSHAWFNDTQMLDADMFVAMTVAALATSRIKLCTGVLIPSNRIAPVTACALASLNKIAPGRIGFGVSTGHTARRAMGLPAITLARMEEYIRVVQGLLNKETLDWSEEGETRKIRFLNPEIGMINIEDSIPLYLSAFGPKGRALTAKLRAGWIGGQGNAETAANALRFMQDAWRAAGNDAAMLYSTNLGSGCVLAEGEPADSARAKAQAGPSAAVLLHAIAEEEEWGSLGHKVPPKFAALHAAYREIYRNYQPSDARYLSNHRGHGLFLRPEEAPLITDDLIRTVTRTGTRDELVDTVRAIKAAGYNQFGIQLRYGHEMEMLDDWAGVLGRV